MRTIQISNEPITGKLRSVVLTNVGASLNYQIELSDPVEGMIIKGEQQSVNLNNYGMTEQEPEAVATAREIMRTKIEDALIEFETVKRNWL